MNFDNKAKIYRSIVPKTWLKPKRFYYLFESSLHFEWRLCLMQYLELDCNMKLCNECACVRTNERTHKKANIFMSVKVETRKGGN